mmetsp:Transcript_3583/g.10390  ORF Transcript_3583/g.10390 Transcript_3583/m.10390 type:complete len:183 (-) Transcript_3583:92-640(-)
MVLMLPSRCLLVLCLGARGGLALHHVSPAACTAAVSGAVASVSSILYMFLQVITDCPDKSYHGVLACSGDITNLVADVCSVSAGLTQITVACASMDNFCPITAINAIQELALISNTLIAASNTCRHDPFLCTYDTVKAVDQVGFFAESVEHMLHVCDDGKLGLEHTYYVYHRMLFHEAPGAG